MSTAFWITPTCVGKVPAFYDYIIIDNSDCVKDKRRWLLMPHFVFHLLLVSEIVVDQHHLFFTSWHKPWNTLAGCFFVS